MRRSFLSRYATLLLSLIVLVAAFGVWQAKTRSVVHPPPRPDKPQSNALQLLAKSRRADSDLAYQATVTVTANYGGHTMKSVAKLFRAPRKLSIHYIEGDGKGMQSGFNERWFWRQEGATSPVQAYAEVAYRPDEMAAQRFEQLKKNYRATSMGTDTIDGRKTRVIELVALHSQGASTRAEEKRPARRLWIDEKSGLTLRQDTFNYRGEPIMKSVLSKVVLNPKFAPDVFMPPATMVKAAHKNSWMAEEMGDKAKQVAQQAGVEPPQPTFLPAGYSYDNVGLHRCSPTGKEMAALSRYGDGLNVLTVFALAPKQDSAKSGAQVCDFGHGTMAMRSTPQGALVAVGDLPPAVLQRVLASTKVVPAPVSTR